MLQSFEDITDPTRGADRLASLRRELARRGLDGFIVPHADEHQNEYLPPHAERLAWLTGFTGSAGAAVILGDQAALFVDGRYTLQAQAQVDGQAFEMHHLIEEPIHTWLAKVLRPGQKLGYDPWLHTVAGRDQLHKTCTAAEAELVAVESNPIDALWADRPGPPLAPVVPHDLRYTGRSSADKRAVLGKELARAKAAAVVLTQPDSIAWLLNIRGRDVSHAPLPLCFAILYADATLDLFLHGAKITQPLRHHLGADIRLHEPQAFADVLEELGAAGKTVGLDPATAAAWIHDRLSEAGATILAQDDPCQLPKAIKNTVELKGIRAAHVRDGAALTRFLCWLAQTAPGGEIDEIGAAQQLEAFRRETNLLQDLSFDTISGAGPNGAIVHYRVSRQSNRRLQPGELYLVDSGAQYLDGTTDVTRTVAIGTPSEEMRDRFTRVLKGHIAIATLRFPEGTTGALIDVLARQALWQAGLDYDHGTGHGVGCYLSVHEGPQGISKRADKVALQPGMVLSDEPGYYKAGAYGIRIENLIVVTGPAEIDGGDRPMLGFEPLTLAPIDLALVEPSLLTPSERNWLNTYHERVRGILTPLVDETTAVWLKTATRTI